VPLDSRDALLPLVTNGYQYLALEGLVGVGRVVVALEPVLHVLVDVRVPVGCDHRVVHQRAQERYASQLLCTASREPHTPPTRMHYRPLQTREVTRLPGGSAAALERPGADLIEFEVGRLAGGTAGREKL
jgi:hypothetical protein